MSILTQRFSPGQYVTPNFMAYSDSYAPILPSSASMMRPIGATIIFPGPSLPLPLNLDLNRDERVHKQVVKYFKYKTLDKWLYKDMADILNYFKVDNQGVHLISNISEYREDTYAKDSPENIEKKIDYIERFFLTSDTMHRILTKLTRGANINWYDLHKNEFFVKEDIQQQLKKILKETINDRSSDNKSHK